MRPEERPKFLKLCMESAVPFGHKLENTTAKSYFQYLEDLSFSQIEQAFQYIIKSGKYFPKVSELRAVAQEQASHPTPKYQISGTGQMSRKVIVTLAHEWPVFKDLKTEALSIFYHVYLTKGVELLDDFRRLFWDMQRLPRMQEKELKHWCADMADLIQRFKKSEPELEIRVQKAAITHAFNVIHHNSVKYNTEFLTQKNKPAYRQKASTPPEIAKLGDEFRVTYDQIQERWKELDELKLQHRYANKGE